MKIKKMEINEDEFLVTISFQPSEFHGLAYNPFVFWDTDSHLLYFFNKMTENLGNKLRNDEVNNEVFFDEPSNEKINEYVKNLTERVVTTPTSPARKKKAAKKTK
jgi:hypothetical protein